jgi:hypothetical protein
MYRHSLPVVLAVTLISTPAARAADRPVEPLVEKVRKSIKSGATFLKEQQKPGGRWPYGNQFNPDGASALAMLALLTAGEPVNDPVVRAGLEHLRTVKPRATYTVALQTMVFALAGQPEDKPLIQRNVDWLVNARTAKGWGYMSKSGTADNSNTQYALLGLHEGIVAGATVDPAVLQEIRDLFIQTQKANGGWGYQPRKDDAGDNGPRMTMTLAGLCNLLITGMDLDIGKQKLNADGSADNCGIYTENKPIAVALDFITNRLDHGLNRDTLRDVLSPHPLYGLYGLERAGRLTGQRYFGGHDWYREGCLLLVDLQHREGCWDDPATANFGGDRVVGTCFALLFLAKGRTPVLISKLAHGDDPAPPANPRADLPPVGWNRKRSDMRHLVDFCSRELFKRDPMAWQVFDVRKKEAANKEEIRDLAAELLQSPVVFFNGHSLSLSKKEEAVLKEYVDNGGFIVAEACCNSKDFDTDFRALVDRMFGQGALQKLPESHPVWRASGKFEVNPNVFPLYGVSQGCKTVLIYSPNAIAGYWEANDFQGDKGKVAFELGANVVAYATGLAKPKPRLTEMTVARDGPAERTKRGYFRVAQLQRNEDPPAPRAMRNLMDEANKVGLDVILETKSFSPASQKLNGYWFFYMHGREKFHYSDAELKNLKFRLENGGTLLADACCGSKDFDRSFREMVDQLWPKKDLKLEPIPSNDELYSAELNGAAITEVMCRRPGPDGERARPELQPGPPALEGVKYKGRWIVIYSKYDIGCALEKAPSPECIGHDYDSAVKLGRAAVLYSLKR